MDSTGVRIRDLTEPSSGAERLCGGFIKQASRGTGSAYAWCRRALEPPGVLTGLSFGISTCDEWSVMLSQWFGVYSVLFDCFSPSSAFAAELQRFAVPPLRLDSCLGVSRPPRPRFVGWASALEAAYVGAAPPHALAAKLDIEGSEWEALREMNATQFRQLRLLDIELHFCKKNRSIPYAHGRIRPHYLRPAAQMLPVLEALREHFVVVERFVQARGAHTWDEAEAGCTWDRVSGRFPHMSISYVNRRWLEGLEPRPLTPAARQTEPGGLPFGARAARGELCETAANPHGCPGFSTNHNANGPKCAHQE